MDNKTKEFLIYARQNTYASGKKAKIVSGFDVYIIKDGDLEYRDAYIGRDRFFQGQETIFKKSKPVWSMSYRGAAEKGVDTGKIFAILQYFIKEYADNVRFGKSFKKEKDEFGYYCKAEGTNLEFNGREEIYQNNELVHWMNYFGGEIK